MVSVFRFVDFTKEYKLSEQILTQEFNGTEWQKRHELNKDIVLALGLGGT